VLQQTDMQDLALFSLMASPKHKQLKIRLDKVSIAVSLLCIVQDAAHVCIYPLAVKVVAYVVQAKYVLPEKMHHACVLGKFSRRIAIT